jgi:hypothetical protein
MVALRGDIIRYLKQFLKVMVRTSFAEKKQKKRKKQKKQK